MTKGMFFVICGHWTQICYEKAHHFLSVDLTFGKATGRMGMGNKSSLAGEQAAGLKRQLTVVANTQESPRAIRIRIRGIFTRTSDCN